MKKVSIILPVYNMEKKIRLCLDTLLKQTYPCIEIIIVDDGSTDGTLKKCRIIAEDYNQVKVIHTQNQGSGPARNTGIKQATGDYAYFPDADDLLDLQAVEILVRSMEENENDLIVFGFYNVKSDGKVMGEKKYDPLNLSGDYIRQHYEDYISVKADYWIQGAPWNKFFDLKIIQKNKIEFPPLRRHQDEVFVSRYVAKVKRVQFIENVLYSYYTNDVKKEWEKYPVDYLDIAVELKKYRDEIIVNWNEQNLRLKDMIEMEYIFNFIKGLELSFSKKMKLSTGKRKQWISEMIEKNNFQHVIMPQKSEMTYQAIILNLIGRKKLQTLYYFLFLKVMIQKNMTPLFSLTKKVVKKW